MDMAETMNELEDGELERLNDFWDTKTSYILDSFNLNDPDITWNLAIILLTIAVFVLLCYCTLLYKLKK